MELYKTLVETKKLLDLLKNFNDKLWSYFLSYKKPHPVNNPDTVIK